MAVFQKATKKRSKLRLGLVGPSGSGKTFSALAVADGLKGDGRVAVIDTEKGSASLYSDKFDFDVVELESFHPKNYIEAIKAAEWAGYTVCVIDSLSHAWAGKDGALELVEESALKNKGNKFSGWRDVTPLHNQLVDTILSAAMHVICTMRSKTEWVLEKDERTGKTTPKKMGLQPVQRADVDFELSIVGDMDHEHNLVITKSRCEAVADRVFKKPGKDLAEILLTWLNDGAVAAATKTVAKVVDKVTEKVDEHRQDDPSDLRREMAGYLKIIGITKDIGAFLCGVRGHKSTSEMPIDVLKEFVNDLCDVSGYVERNIIPKEVCLDMLQRNDGSDPIKHVIEACKAAEEEARKTLEV